MTAHGRRQFRILASTVQLMPERVIALDLGVRWEPNDSCRRRSKTGRFRRLKKRAGIGSLHRGEGS
jgi:hypothetical protein